MLESKQFNSIFGQFFHINPKMHKETGQVLSAYSNIDTITFDVSRN
jgi:hypothetical protein